MVAVVGLLCIVRSQDADVAGAHLVARRTRRGADRRFGDPCWYSLENGWLRVPALLGADVPVGEPGTGAIRVRALCRRHHLHVAGRARAGR